MTVEQLDRIDYRGVYEDSREIVLMIDDHLPWDDHNHLLQLERKINLYLAYLEAEESSDGLSFTRGWRTKLRIFFDHPPDDRAVTFLKRVSEILDQAGLGFDFKVTPPTP